MALIFSSSIANSFIFRGVMGGISGVATTGTYINAYPTPSIAVTIYSGAQPSCSAITGGWTNYNSNYLFHQPGITVSMPNPTIPGTGAFLTRSNIPTPVTALNSGTAAWCIIWCSNVADGTSSGQIRGSTLPNPNFIVGPVTLGSGNGVVTLQNLTITTGTSATIADLTIKYQI